MKFSRIFGAAAAAAALSVAIAPAASADTVVTKDNVEMVIFGSGYHVDKVTIHGIPEPQGPAQYEFIYSATTSPTKTYTMICGGSSTGSSCLHQFKINATYAHGVGIKSCGQLKRLDNNQSLGVACKSW
ncbi:hypothetical protein [Amycolatopsis sp. NPDC051128]|uniref:hypothetical protein n=1 Tax=Amycolatopsis sp. NPDC051128 TaxID=3155412 RepID=UPI0034280D61